MGVSKVILGTVMMSIVQANTGPLLLRPVLRQQHFEGGQQGTNGNTFADMFMFLSKY